MVQSLIMSASNNVDFDTCIIFEQWKMANLKNYFLICWKIWPDWFVFCVAGLLQKSTTEPPPHKKKT